MFQQCVVQAVAHRGTFCTVDSVLHLVWILFHIIQLIGIAQMQNQFVPAVCHAPHHLQAAESVVVHFIAGKLRVHTVIDAHVRVADLGHHAPALQQARDGQAHVCLLYTSRCV